MELKHDSESIIANRKLALCIYCTLLTSLSKQKPYTQDERSGYEVEIGQSG